MIRAWLAVALLAALVTPAGAQDVERLTGTLEKVRSSGQIVVGVRDASLPFSYRVPDGRPIGYAVSLCVEVVDEVAAELDGMPVSVVYKTVTPEDRISRVTSGDVDLECGSTTRTAERQKVVAFSPVFFIAGTKLLVARGSAVRSYRDLGGKTAVVTAGTTNEAALRRLVERLHVPITIVTAPDHDQSFALLKAGHADAFATDDVLLAGLVAGPDGAAFHVVGDYLSYEPYGLMYRKNDPEFAAVVERAFARMAETGRLSELYTRWLVKRLPTGEQLDIPISAELAEVFRAAGAPD
jgi:glutamate/aspartate transport system substrate-binding protein